MKSSKILFSLVVILVLTAACAPAAKPTATMPAINDLSQPLAGGQVFDGQLAVEIKGFAFNPDTATVKVGTQVTWTNKDSAPHSATADDGSFDTGTLTQGESFTFQFNTPGAYTYICTHHPSMKATIIVIQ